MKSLRERFEEKYQPEPNSGCYLWTAGLTNKGYGKIWVGGRTLGAHRVAWELEHGPIPEGMCVLHRCDMRICVNPEHLFLGTVADNNADMTEKGRQVTPIGERHGQAKVTEADVRYILASTETQAVLAERFGIDPSCVSLIRSRKNWKHVK